MPLVRWQRDERYDLARRLIDDPDHVGISEKSNGWWLANQLREDPSRGGNIRFDRMDDLLERLLPEISRDPREIRAELEQELGLIVDPAKIGLKPNTWDEVLGFLKDFQSRLIHSDRTHFDIMQKTSDGLDCLFDPNGQLSDEARFKTDDLLSLLAGYRHTKEADKRRIAQLRKALESELEAARKRQIPVIRQRLTMALQRPNLAQGRDGSQLTPKYGPTQMAFTNNHGYVDYISSP